MRIVIESTRPAEEIAAEPATLARLRLLLDRARTAPHNPGRVLPGGLLALPLIPDTAIPPLTVHLRPHPPMGPTS
ncbi:hypothetical protein [Streptomyces sp. IBSBF 2435]|uniref:hypothetical protein n=1 Tax=Streptomyces sp. IBSBF 2435 TaxID=2903531 RepID=UPI002FDBFBC6